MKEGPCSLHIAGQGVGDRAVTSVRTEAGNRKGEKRSTAGALGLTPTHPEKHTTKTTPDAGSVVVTCV